MLQPHFLPRLERETIPLPPMRFGMTHTSSVVSCDDPKLDPLHIHGYLEVFFNLDAEVSFLVNDRLYPVARGEAIVSRPNDVHVCIYHGTRRQEYICLWIDADPASPLFSFLQGEHTSPLLSFSTEREARLRQLFAALETQYQSGGDGLAASAYLLEILSVFNEGNTEKKSDAPLPETLRRIIDDMRSSYAQIRTVNDVLATHYVSSSTLTRWFREYLHTSPREYLESQKLASAMALLKQGASVTDACMRSGFSDSSYFIVRFKKKFGETPLQYKKRVHQSTD